MPIVEPADIKLSIGTYGLKSLEVNGNDWTEFTKSVNVVAEDSSVPVVSVVMIPAPFEVEGPGVIMVKGSGDGAKASILDFLNHVDPAWIDTVSLESMSWGSDGSPGAMILEALKKMAESIT